METAYFNLITLVYILKYLFFFLIESNSCEPFYVKLLKSVYK